MRCIIIKKWLFVIVLLLFFTINIIVAISVYTDITSAKAVIDVSQYYKNINSNLVANPCPKVFFDEQHLYVAKKIETSSGKYVAIDQKLEIDMKKGELIIGATESKIIYYENDNTLNVRNRFTGECIVVDKCVSLVQCDNEYLYYQKTSLSGNEELWSYNLSTAEYELLANSIVTFALDGDYIWFANNVGQEDSVFRNEIIRFSIKEKSLETFLFAKNNEEISRILVSEEFIILSFNTSAEILIVSKADSGIQWWPQVKNGVGHVIANFNKKYLYFSYSIYQPTIPDDIASVASVGQGMYRYDLDTHECIKICDITFDNLYVFNETLVWGTCGEKVYCITSDSSLVVEITVQ